MFNTIPVFIKNLSQSFMDQEFTQTVDIKNKDDDNEVLTVDTAAFTYGTHKVDLSKDVALPKELTMDDVNLLYLVTVKSVFFKENDKFYGINLSNVQFRVDHEEESCSISLDMGVGREAFILKAKLDLKNKVLEYTSTLPFMLDMLVTEQTEVVLEKEVNDINDI